MNRNQVIAVSITALLIIAVFLFGRFKPTLADLEAKDALHSEETDESSGMEDSEASSFDTEAYLKALVASLPVEEQEKFSVLQETLNTGEFQAYQTLINFLIDRGELLGASIFALRNAEVQQQDSVWNKAGALLLRTYRLASLEPEERSFTRSQSLKLPCIQSFL
jgi:hypothetical protein